MNTGAGSLAVVEPLVAPRTEQYWGAPAPWPGAAATMTGGTVAGALKVPSHRAPRPAVPDELEKIKIKIKVPVRTLREINEVIGLSQVTGRGGGKGLAEDGGCAEAWVVRAGGQVMPRRLAHVLMSAWKVSE